MIINDKLKRSKLPQIYKREGKDCYLDPIRERLIFITPEETVRQHVIAYLVNDLHVPKDMIRVEVRLDEYGIKTRNRADIIVEEYDENTKKFSPLVVIECKAPEILLGYSVEKQMLDYANMLGCPFCFATNGEDVLCLYYDEKKESYIEVKDLPPYSKMVKRVFKEAPISEQLPRLTLQEIKSHPDTYIEMGTSTLKKLKIPCTNLWECLLYQDHKMPAGQYKLFKLVEDYGVRGLTYGNAAGGKFQGAYRSFIIEYNGSTEFVSIGFSTYCTDKKPDNIRTSLNVAIDNAETAHHALQLIIDDNLAVVDNTVTFYHHGKIGIGNIGSGRIDELREFVRDKYPFIIDGKRFNLGSLKNDRLWNLDDPEVMNLVENLISYALIRDEYRRFVKENRKKS